MNNYAQIAQMMHLSTKSIKKVLNLIESLDNQVGVIIYNTITTADLSMNEMQFAFFLWGMNFTLFLQNEGLMEE